MTAQRVRLLCCLAALVLAVACSNSFEIPNSTCFLASSRASAASGVAATASNTATIRAAIRMWSKPSL